MSTITAPQGIVWAFNPYYVEIEDDVNDVVTITIGSNSIEVYLYQNKARAYITRMLQLLFEDPVNGARAVNGTIEVKDYYSGETLESFDVFVVWGAVEIGDRFPTFTGYKYDEDHVWMQRTINYFVNYPFTVDFLFLQGMSYKTRQDSGVYDEAVSVEENTMQTFVGGTDIPNDMTKRWVLRQDMDNRTGVFDYTFDYTFGSPSETTMITKVIPRVEQEGYYLRWIDRFGFRQYYLFDKGDKTYKTELSEYKKEYGTVYGGMHYNYQHRPLGINTGIVMKMCASNLDAETLQCVEGIVSAPVVDMFLGYTKDGTELWQPIYVAGGDYTRSARSEHHDPLQDFEITVNVPNRVTQTL